MSAFRDEWEERDPALDKWASPRDHKLDGRLVDLGFKVGARHVAGCLVGLVPEACCTCREAGAAMREAQRRAPGDRPR